MRLMHAIVFSVSLLEVAAAAQSGAARLTVADVEKITGIKGIQVIAPGSVPGAGAGTNFAGPDKKMILKVNTGPAALYSRAKAQKEYAGMPMPLFHADVAGIGDEA